MAYRIIVPELTWDEPDCDAEDQVNGEEDQLKYCSAGASGLHFCVTYPSDRPINIPPMSKQIDPFHLLAVYRERIVKGFSTPLGH